MKKVLFAAFAGLCVTSAITSAVMGSTATKAKHVVAYTAIDTIPKPDTMKYAMILDTVPKHDTSKYASIAHYVMDTVPKHDTSKLADYVAMK